MGECEADARQEVSVGETVNCNRKLNEKVTLKNSFLLCLSSIKTFYIERILFYSRKKLKLGNVLFHCILKKNSRIIDKKNIDWTFNVNN